MGKRFHNGILAGLAVVLLAGLVPANRGTSQPAAMTLLTDTQHYCAELFAEVEAMRRSLVDPAPAAVETLAQEGRRLCALGEVRGGVIRLRRAMVLLHENSGRS